MVKVSVAKLMSDWDVMIGNVEKDETLRTPQVQELRQQLLEARQKLKELLDQQSHLEGLRKGVTQQVQLAKELGFDVAIKLRGAIRSHHGHRHPGLTSFRMRPIPQRPRHRRQEEESQPPSEAGPSGPDPVSRD
jgi:hypothetical protein